MNVTKSESGSGRIDIVDALRGFALAGIVIVHFTEQFMGAPAPEGAMSKISQGPFDLGIDIFTNLFLRGKFFALFSLLFGLSFYIQMERAAHRGSDFRWRFLWRLIILLAIGFIHHLIYRGDILTIYALLGMVLILFHRMQTGWLLALAAVIFLGLPRFIIYYWLGAGSIFSSVEFTPEAPEIVIYFETLKTGSMWQVFTSNAGQGFLMKADFQLGVFSRGYLTFAFFLAGMILGRTGFFADTGQYTAQIRRAVKWSAAGLVTVIVIAVILFSVQDPVNESGIHSWTAMAGLTLYDLFNLFLTVIIASFFILIYDKAKSQKWMNSLVPYGRTALTNYVLQSVAGTALFYGWGMGMLGEIRNIQVLFIACIVILIQVLVSRWWLSRFRFGPLEWVWRMFTFGKFFPLRLHVETPEYGQITRSPDRRVTPGDTISGK